MNILATVELPKLYPILLALKEILDNQSTDGFTVIASRLDPFTNAEHDDATHTSKEALNKLIEDGISHPFAMFKRVGMIDTESAKEFTDKLSALFGDAFGLMVPLSGNFLYSTGYYMAWHTNELSVNDWTSNIRIYVTHNTDDKSEFRYFKDGEYHVYKEPIGWSIKVFDCTKRFWHCVVGGEARHSFGFKLFGATRDLLT